jgi:hypothetical protein
MCSCFPLTVDLPALGVVTRRVLAPYKSTRTNPNSLSSSSARFPQNAETLAAQTPSIAAVQSIPRPRRGYHRDRRPRLALYARGIDPNHPVAPPSTSSSPTMGAGDSGEPVIPLPRHHARRDPGKLLRPIACLARSIASRSAAASINCVRRRSTSPASTLR